MMELKNNLNRIMFELGLAEGELASVCKLDQGHLNRIKNGRVRPTLVTALRIGRALGMSVNRIFYLDEVERRDGETRARANARASRDSGVGEGGRRGGVRSAR